MGHTGTCAKPTIQKKRRKPWDPLNVQQRKEKRARKADLDEGEQIRLHNGVISVTCSGSWYDDVYAEADAQGVNVGARHVAERLATFGIYPPPADEGPGDEPRRRAVVMRRCDGCKKIYPPNFLISAASIELCADCASGWGAGTAQLAIMVDGARRQRVYGQLRAIGLKDREIVVLSLEWEEWSQRKIADFTRVSRARVRSLLDAAHEKLKAARLKLPSRQRHIRYKSIKVDPAVLDKMIPAKTGRATLPPSVA